MFFFPLTKVEKPVLPALTVVPAATSTPHGCGPVENKSLLKFGPIPSPIVFQEMRAEIEESDFQPTEIKYQPIRRSLSSISNVSKPRLMSEFPRPYKKSKSFSYDPNQIVRVRPRKVQEREPKKGSNGPSPMARMVLLSRFRLSIQTCKQVTTTKLPHVSSYDDELKLVKEERVTLSKRHEKIMAEFGVKTWWEN